MVGTFALSGCGGSEEGGAALPNNFGPEPTGNNDADFIDETEAPVFGRDEPAPTGSPGQPQHQVLDVDETSLGQCAELQDDVCGLCLCLDAIDCTAVCEDV